MLSDKRWKLDALMRLLVRIFVCIFAGSVVINVVHVVRSGKIQFLFFPVAVAALVFLALTLILISKPWVLETFVRRLVFLLVCLYAGFLLCIWSQKLAGPTHP